MEDISEAQKNAQCNGSEEDVDKTAAENARLSPPKPENVPVFAPLTVEDVFEMDTSTKNKPSDNDSLIVNPDETQSEMDFSVSEDQSVNDEPIGDESTDVPTVDDNSAPESAEVPTIDDNSAPEKEAESKDSSEKDSSSVGDVSKDNVSPSETINSSVEQSTETSAPAKAKRFVF